MSFKISFRIENPEEGMMVAKILAPLAVFPDPPSNVSGFPDTNLLLRGLVPGPAQGQRKPWGDPDKWEGQDSKVGESYSGPSTTHTVSVSFHSVNSLWSSTHHSCRAWCPGAGMPTPPARYHLPDGARTFLSSQSSTPTLSGP